MIKNKKDLEVYLHQDKIALYKKNKKRPSWFGDDIWKFQITLRKLEFYTNCHGSIIHKIKKVYLKFRFKKMSRQLGFSFPINVCDAGLSIAHYGVLVVNGNAKIGKNCRIQEMVCIGATNGNDAAPKIGNDCFIGSGAKIIGDIQISDGVAIGANSVVCKSILEPNTTWAGVPAKKVSDKGAKENLCPDLFSV